jgi:hypothetical protein
MVMYIRSSEGLTQSLAQPFWPSEVMDLLLVLFVYFFRNHTYHLSFRNAIQLLLRHGSYPTEATPVFDVGILATQIFTSLTTLSLSLDHRASYQPSAHTPMRVIARQLRELSSER